MQEWYPNQLVLRRPADASRTYEMSRVSAVLVLAAYDLLASLRDDTLAVLDVARFPVGGKRRTALLAAQRPPGGTVVGFRWSGDIGRATESASPLPDCDFHLPSRHGSEPATAQVRLVE